MVRTLAATAGDWAHPLLRELRSHMAFHVPKIFSNSDGQFCGAFFFFFFWFFLLALFGCRERMIKYKLKNPTGVNGTMKSYYKVKLLLNSLFLFLSLPSITRKTGMDLQHWQGSFFGESICVSIF